MQCPKLLNYQISLNQMGIFMLTMAHDSLYFLYKNGDAVGFE